MRIFLQIFTALIFMSCAKAQPDTIYEALIARASLFHLQKDYKSAIACFEKAFSRHQPNALNAYKAAGVNSLDSNMDKGFYYINLSLKLGWTEADQLAFDPYFEYLRTVSPEKWKKVEENAFSSEKKYEEKLALPSLRKTINRMALTDQRLRYAQVQAGSKEERQRISHDIHVADSINRAEVKAIFRQYGWPKISEIGRDGQNNFWLIVQHADDDLALQQAALSAMQKLRKTGEVNLENYAFLYDRVQCNLNYRQLYGTQVNWTAHGKATGFRSIAGEDGVDERRNSMGMLPLRLYALTYGFDYKNISVAASKKRDSVVRQNTCNLIDSATYFYRRKDFEKMYDCYDQASMIPGGMNNIENFRAAILFSRVAAQTKNSRFKSMALDFLNLLYLRHALSKNKLKAQPAFSILYKEPRWESIYSRL
ncbi:MULTISPECIES: DUF6624 domain-containing protein [Niastella]|uniref:Tetratricopeptide repeat protein n=1 Tax=Niastella soli TaxID=2821487 RepID=A0ABS3YY16_9BACT|nr:DUF6624 domain-containing protein [Niastella soli]MBO9202046.1 hypothetical protein [Niastella soli]